jgi:hypothetical protein
MVECQLISTDNCLAVYELSAKITFARPARIDFKQGIAA